MQLRRHSIGRTLALLCATCMCAALSATTCLGQLSLEAAPISSGEYEPFFKKEEDAPIKKVSVASFLIDRTPVTVRAFSKFLRSHPQWRKEQTSPLYADASYLRIPFEGAWDYPVTRVSWFAARAYCTSVGGRLPTVAEWEYVASASETKKDASRDPEFVQRILDWYSSAQKLRAVSRRQPNIWGVSEMHGLIWEWTEDFNSIFVAGDNRRDGEENKNLFCGAGAVGAADKANYAAFMRYAVRSSLKGNYTMESLGFRCAYDLQRKPS